MMALRRKLGCLLVVVWAGVLSAQPAWGGARLVRVLLDGPLPESPVPEMDLSVLLTGEQPRTLYEWVRAIERAAADERVQGLVLILEQPQLGLAQVEELHRALQRFRASGKKVHCYLDYAGNLEMALASAADHITLAETSPLDVVGLHAELSFYKGLLDKVGIQAELMHCGDYKTALEPYTRTEPSRENVEMVNWLLDGLYDRFVRLIAEGRRLPVEKVRQAIDAAPLDDREALEYRLVDAVGSYPQFKQMLHKEYGRDVELVKNYGKKKPFDVEIDPTNPFAALAQLQELMSRLFGGEEEDGKPGLALIFIDGPIVVGRNEPDLLFGGSVAGSTTIRAALEKARTDKRIRGVVVRVNSPGGSALASDIIWEAATRLRQEKPLVVSMGNVAGSGGYYVSIPGDTIFAEETTLTGSIGVVGGKFVWRDLWEGKLGVTTSEFKRGQHADLMSPNRPWTEPERQIIRKWLDDVYEQFKNRVQTSRGPRLKGELEPLAGGRVYTGKQALERGLVDRLGGLSDALQYAAGKAGLGDDYEVYRLPKPRELADVLRKALGEELEDEWEVSAALPGPQHPLLETLLRLMADVAPAQRDRLRDLRHALILQREHIGCFMPFSLRIR